MARHVAETGQGAFTWTGPYGTGKSSLAVALSALLSGNEDTRNNAARLFGRATASGLWKKLPTGTKGWRVLPIVGRRDDPVQVIGEGVEASELGIQKPRGGWTEKNLIQSLHAAASRNPKAYGGLIVFIDEMGKFLEAAAQEGTDVYLFQQLAEAASRSSGRLIIVGVLHQAFEEYAHRLSHQLRDEWSKILGPVCRSCDQHLRRGADRSPVACHREPSQAPQSGAARENDRPHRALGLRSRQRTASAYARGLLAAPSCHRLSAWSDLAASVRSKPAQPVRFPEFLGTAWFRGLSEAGLQRRFV